MKHWMIYGAGFVTGVASAGLLGGWAVARAIGKRYRGI